LSIPGNEYGRFQCTDGGDVQGQAGKKIFSSRDLSKGLLPSCGGRGKKEDLKTADKRGNLSNGPPKEGGSSP